MSTNAAVVATKKADSDWGNSTYDKLSTHQDYTQKHWDNDIGQGNEDYKLYMYTNSTRVELDDPDDRGEALRQCRDYLYEQTNLFGTFDSIIVVDTRDFDGGHGTGYLKRAGTTWGVGYTDGSGGKNTTAHELGHNYGGQHADSEQEAKDGGSTFESTCCEHSILGNYGDWDCNVNHSYTATGHWYSDCTRYAVRSYIDNSGNI